MPGLQQGLEELRREGSRLIHKHKPRVLAVYIVLLGEIVLLCVTEHAISMNSVTLRSPNNL